MLILCYMLKLGRGKGDKRGVVQLCMPLLQKDLCGVLTGHPIGHRL